MTELVENDRIVGGINSVSTKKIRHLGWKPKYNLLKDLPKIIEWYKNNLTLYKNCK